MRCRDVVGGAHSSVSPPAAKLEAELTLKTCAIANARPIHRLDARDSRQLEAVTARKSPGDGLAGRHRPKQIPVLQVFAYLLAAIHGEDCTLKWLPLGAADND